MTTATKPRDPASLQKALEIDFRRPALLEQALVHRSYLNEAPELDLNRTSGWSSWEMRSWGW